MNTVEEIFGECLWNICFETGPLATFYGTYSEACAYADAHYPGYKELKENVQPKQENPHA